MAQINILPKQSNKVTLVISYLIARFLMQSITREYIAPALVYVMVQFTFKSASKHLWKWINLMCIQSELRFIAFSVNASNAN